MEVPSTPVPTSKKTWLYIIGVIAIGLAVLMVAVGGNAQEAEPVKAPRDVKIETLTQEINAAQAERSTLKPYVDRDAELALLNRINANALAELGMGVEWGTGSVKVYPFPGVAQQ